MLDGTAFTTVRVTDPDLTQLLEMHKVEIRGEVDNTNGGILGILFSWVLPLVLMGAFWFMRTHRPTTLPNKPPSSTPMT